MSNSPGKLLFLSITLLSLLCPVVRAEEISNPQIDMKTHLRISSEAAAYREKRRLTEDQFVKMSSDRKTVVLDARSKAKFDLLHVKGAVNLSFPDIDIQSLQQTIPDKNTRILIYCNNNFANEIQAFPSKMPSTSLNISTFITLYSYGYRNLYELGPFLDVRTTKIPLVSSNTQAVK